MIDYLEFTAEERQQTIQSLNNEMGSPEEYQVSQLIQVIKGQHECITDHGWWDIWCVEDDAHTECFQGTVEEFAARLVKDGWEVDSIERFTAICPSCINREPEVSEEEERMDALVYQYRKGEQG